MNLLSKSDQEKMRSAETFLRDKSGEAIKENAFLRLDFEDGRAQFIHIRESRRIALSSQWQANVEQARLELMGIPVRVFEN